MALNTLTITHYQHRNRHAVQDLLFRSYRTHSHLDWHETEDWLEEADPDLILLAWQNMRLQGILAVAPPLHQTTWVRLASVSDQCDAASVLAEMWDALKPELSARDVQSAALLIVRNWLTSYAPTLGFHFAEEIITFRRPDLRIPDAPPPPNVALRLGRTDRSAGDCPDGQCRLCPTLANGRRRTAAGAADRGKLHRGRK